MTELNVDGMALAPGVVETIISIAVNEVEGVAGVSSSSISEFRSVFSGKSATQGVEITQDEEGNVLVCVHLSAYYGYVLPDLAVAVRKAVVDALTSQVGVTVTSVDVHIDAIQFNR